MSEIDSFGLRSSGKTTGGYPVIYTAEYAQQSNQSFNVDYLRLETGISVTGVIVKLGFERRASDNGNYTFATPIANDTVTTVGLTSIQARGKMA